GDDARVVLEDGEAEVVAGELLRRAEDRLFEAVLIADLRVRFVEPRRRAAVAHGARERLVLAVLAPVLGDRLELAVVLVAALVAEMAADRVELPGGEREAALLVRLVERGERRRH